MCYDRYVWCVVCGVWRVACGVWRAPVCGVWCAPPCSVRCGVQYLDIAATSRRKPMSRRRSACRNNHAISLVNIASSIPMFCCHVSNHGLPCVYAVMEGNAAKEGPRDRRRETAALIGCREWCALIGCRKRGNKGESERERGCVCERERERERERGTISLASSSTRHLRLACKTVAGNTTPTRCPTQL